MQILVVVATTQTRYSTNLLVFDALRSVVEKVSSKLANMRGLVGPKPRLKSFLAKGNQVNIPELLVLVNTYVNIIQSP